jgi:G3E family GTPase
MIKDLKRGLNPDFLFIEPFELVITNEIRTALSMGLRDVSYEIGPFIALVDAPTFEYSWEERKTTILNHVVGADVVAITRIDLVEPEYLETIRDALMDYANTNRLLNLSFPLRQGMNDIIGMVS